MKKAIKFLVLMTTVFAIFFIMLNYCSYASTTTLASADTQFDPLNAIIPTTDQTRQNAYQYLGVNPNNNNTNLSIHHKKYILVHLNLIHLY